MRHPVAGVLLYISVILPLFLFLVFGLTLKYTLLNPEFLHHHAKKTGRYQTLAQNLPQLLGSGPEVEEIRIDPVWVEETAYRLLKNIGDYLWGKTPRLEGTVDLTPVYNQLITQKAKAAGLTPRQIQEILSQQELSNTKIDLFGSPLPNQANSPRQILTKVKNGLKIFTLMLYGAGLLFLACLALIAYWCRGSPRKMLQWLAIPFFIEALLWVIVGITGKIISINIVQNMLAQLTQEPTGSLAGILLPLQVSIMQSLENTLLIIFGIIAALTLLLIVVAHFLPQSSAQSRET